MEQHTKGIKTFFKKHGIDDHMALAEEYHQRWLRRKSEERNDRDLLYYFSLLESSGLP
mgnify:FL=1